MHHHLHSASVSLPSIPNWGPELLWAVLGVLVEAVGVVTAFSVVAVKADCLFHPLVEIGSLPSLPPQKKRSPHQLLQPTPPKQPKAILVPSLGWMANSLKLNANDDASKGSDIIALFPST